MEQQLWLSRSSSRHKIVRPRVRDLFSCFYRESSDFNAFRFMTSPSSAVTTKTKDVVAGDRSTTEKEKEKEKKAKKMKELFLS